MTRVQIAGDDERQGMQQYLERLVALDNRAAVRLQVCGLDPWGLERTSLRSGGAAAGEDSPNRPTLTRWSPLSGCVSV